MFGQHFGRIKGMGLCASRERNSLREGWSIEGGEYKGATVPWAAPKGLRTQYKQLSICMKQSSRSGTNTISLGLRKEYTTRHNHGQYHRTALERMTSSS